MEDKKPGFLITASFSVHFALSTEVTSSLTTGFGWMLRARRGGRTCLAVPSTHSTWC